MEKKTEAQQIRELGDRFMKIHEGPFDDDNFGLGDHGRELDQDDTGDGKGYDKEPMFDQLGKIIDTQTGDAPITTVTTDDNKEIQISPSQAKTLRMFATAEGIKSNIRAQFQRDIQHSRGLIDFADINDSNEMGNMFIKKYL